MFTRGLPLLDVLLLTSHMEANPIRSLEAMAAGKPAVATRVGSVTESVQPGKKGDPVCPGDAKAWRLRAGIARRP